LARKNAPVLLLQKKTARKRSTLLGQSSQQEKQQIGNVSPFIDRTTLNYPAGSDPARGALGSHHRERTMKTRKYTVTYQVPHWHTVTVGIQAKSAREACSKAHAAFLDLSLWEDSETRPLLVDDFDEDTQERIEIENERRIDDAKNPIGFSAQWVAQWPQPSEVVLKDRRHRNALALLAEIRQLCPILDGVGEPQSETSLLDKLHRIWPRLQALTSRD